MSETLANANILLVEDDANDVAIALRAFRRSDLGECVAVARDGVEALERLRAVNGESDEEVAEALPKVVLLDLRMPRVDGWQVLREVRSDPRTRDLPVVVVSSSRRPADIRESYRLGANSYVVKRFDTSSPGQFLVDAVRYWIDLNEVP